MSEETLYHVPSAFGSLLWWNGLCVWGEYGEIRPGDCIAAKSAGRNRGKYWILDDTSLDGNRRFYEERTRFQSRDAQTDRAVH